MENTQDKKEHWKSRVAAIQSKNIFELANMLDEISSEKWVVASQVYQTQDGYDCLIYYKEPPKEMSSKQLMNEIKREDNSDRPTEKQLRFLKEKRFKIEPNLTKREATRKIKEYLDRLNDNKNIREDKIYDY